MTWYKRILEKNRTTLFSGAAFTIIFVLSFTLWQHFENISFQWRNISPISSPTIFERSFYSALVFVTIGALLYWLKFYRFLYRLAVRKLRDRKLYKDTKRFIWGLLILLVFSVFSKIVDLLNSILSFLYNILSLIIFVLPPLGISIAIFIIGLLIVKLTKMKI